MLRTRIIPCLLLRGSSLVKTVKFNKFEYIGDPLNTCRIFNELEVDEMTILDITVSKEGKKPNLKILESLASECFMPLAYGGGITSFGDAEKIFSIGFEKVVLNSVLFNNPRLISEIAKKYGTQSIVVSIDVKKNIFRGYDIYSLSGTKKQKDNLCEWVNQIESLGAGEILLTNIDNEGTWKGFDIPLVKLVSDSVRLPVVAHGGAGNIEHIVEVVRDGHASAVALGSMLVFQKKGMGILVNFPDKNTIKDMLK